jgi:hypothetical protein
VGAQLVHADGQTDMTKLTVAFCNFANILKNNLGDWTEHFGMWERLTRHHNKVVILMHLLVFYEDICLKTNSLSVHYEACIAHSNPLQALCKMKLHITSL